MSTKAVRREYDRLAPVYEDRWGGYVQATAAQTIHRLSLQPTDHLLDIGCGTGTLLRSVIRLYPSVTAVGIDLSPAMLAVARPNLPPTVQLLPADATALPFRAHTFDIAVSSSSYHYWPDPVSGLQEIARVLRPAGRLVITDWCDDYWACKLCDRVLRLVNRAHRRIFGASACRAHLAAASFEVTALDRYKVSWLWGMMTASARLRAA